MSSFTELSIDVGSAPPPPPPPEPPPSPPGGQLVATNPAANIAAAVAALGAAAAPAAAPARGLAVPAPAMLVRCPHLRGGWTNFYHKADVTGFPLEVAHTASTDVGCRFRPRDGETVQAAYLTELAEVMTPIAKSLTVVWQDVNRQGSES